MRVPLQYQIMLPLAGVAAVSLLTVAAINARLATSETHAAIDRQLAGVVRVLATSNFPLTETVLRQMKSLSGAEFVLLGQADRLISASDAALAVKLPKTDTVGKSESVALGAQMSVEGKSYFHSAIRLQRDLNSPDSSVLHILFPREQYDAAWRSAFLPPLVIAVFAVTAVVLVTQWIANRISRSLTQLGAGVQRLAGGEFTPLDLPERDDEVQDLARAVNQTATRLADYEQHVRQTEQVRTVAMLGAGVAHEMRNAATGCRLAIDLHAESCPNSAGDDSLAVAKSQLKLMESRLQRFLQLGREDVATIKQPVDLKQLVDELLPLVQPAAHHVGVTVHWKPSAKSTWVLANPDSLGMVIVNLLLNAIEAAQKQHPVSQEARKVSLELLEGSAGQVEFEVSDSGAGMPDMVAENLFKPFVTTKAEGVGLGLAVARQVATEHGGDIYWNRQEGQTRFRLSLPRLNFTQSGLAIDG
jgi:signal transduction histidine kinase